MYLDWGGGSVEHIYAIVHRAIEIISLFVGSLKINKQVDRYGMVGYPDEHLGH